MRRSRILGCPGDTPEGSSWLPSPAVMYKQGERERVGWQESVSDLWHAFTKEQSVCVRRVCVQRPSQLCGRASEVSALGGPHGLISVSDFVCFDLVSRPAGVRVRACVRVCVHAGWLCAHVCLPVCVCALVAVRACRMHPLTSFGSRLPAVSFA